MGLLDNAIRDHLELKRQHGADPTELARLEREALGPPVRETQEVLTAAARPAAGAPAGPDTTAEEPLSTPEAEPVVGGPSAEPGEPTVAFDAEQAMAEEANGSAGVSAPAPPTAEPVVPPAQPPASPSEPAAPAPDPADPTAADPATAEPAAPAPAESTPPEPAAPPSADEPPAPGTAEGEEGEDVLEETPDFLQETPEHDRLWFEQRPPRDFDFDD
ncbi:MAG: hypothetical protein ACJ76S_08405 [Solirubrobacteraceae bacterium]